MIIEIFFVSPTQPLHIKMLSVPEQCTVEQAFFYAQQQHPLIPPLKTTDTLGIFGRRCKSDTILKAYDRIEVYAPLIVDPKMARKLTAQAQHMRQARK